MGINISGKSYVGRNVVINNGKVIIDGVDVTPNGKKIEINVNGDIDSINADTCDKIIINGNVGKDVHTSSGDIECGDVSGNVKSSSGDIECGNVGGDVNSTAGDIKAENITGNVKTLSGDIKYRK